MTNPYAPPDAQSGSEPTARLPSLLTRFLSNAVTGVVLAGAVVSLPVPLMGPPGFFRTIAEIYVGIVLLVGIIGFHAWSCRNLLQLLTASIAVAWGTLLTFLLLVSSLRGVYVRWPDFGLALLTLPAALTLIGWPFMHIAQRRRNRNSARQPTDESQ